MLSDDNDARRRWFKLVSLLNRRGRRAMIAQLGEAIRAHPTVENLPGLMKAGGPDLLKYGGFGAAPDDTIIKVVLPNTTSKAGRAWLRTVEVELKAWASACGGGARDALTQRLKTMAKSRRPETALWAELMGDRLNLS